MQPPGSQSSTAVQLPDTIDGVPNVSGAEQLVAQALRGSERRPLTGGHDGGDPVAGIRSACAIGLHMHRPLIPAGGEDLRTAPLIGNLQDIFEHPDIGENHNAAVFCWCYWRIGELIPAANRRNPASRIRVWRERLGQGSPRPARSRASAWCPDAAHERRQVDHRGPSDRNSTRGPRLRPAAPRHPAENRPEVVATKVAANRAEPVRGEPTKTATIPMTKLHCT
jgi:hypothetical protein